MRDYSDADRYLSTKQVAEMLGLKEKSLANARYKGTGIGIPYHKLGSAGRVIYKLSDIQAYLDRNFYNHTGEAK